MSETSSRHVLRRLPAATIVVATVCASFLATTVPGASLVPAHAAGVGTHLRLTQVPTTADPDTDLSTQPKVEVLDADDNVVSSANPIALTLLPVGNDLSGVLDCDETDNSETPSSGVAQFAGCEISHGGKYTIRASSSGLTSATSAEVFVSGPAKISFSGQPGGDAAGAVWGDQPQLSVVDGNGVVISSETHELGVAIKPGTGTSGATLSCTEADRTLNAVSGVATFAGCAIDKAGTGYRLVGVDLTEHVYGTSAAFTVTAGTPTQVVFTQQPSNGAGGAALPTQPVVAVKDANGNTVPGNTDAITLTLTAGTGTSGAHLAGCTSSVNAVDGVATFSGCAVDLSGTAYTLTATDSARSATATSSPFSIGAGAPTALSFTTQPSGGAAGAAFGTQPAVTLTDAGGNPKPGLVTLTLTGGTSGAALTCSVNPQTAVSAAATFAGCSVDLPGQDYQLHAVSGSLTADSDAFDVAVGTAASVAFTTSPDDSTGGSSFGDQPVVELRDAGGNLAAGNVTLSITSGTGAPGAALDCAHATVAAVNGVASFSGCDVDLAGTGYSLTATSGSVHGVSTRFDISTGSASRIRFVTQPGDGTGGSALSTQPVVEVQDAGGNAIAGADTQIRLAVAAGTGLGTLTCSSNPQPVVRGAAAFQACRLDKTASAYRLVATDSAHGFTATSDPFAVTPGPAHRLQFTASPKTATAGVAFATTPTVKAVDKGGNPVNGAHPVRLSLSPVSGATLSCDALTQSDGTFTGCSIDTAAGGYALTATDGDGRTAESPSFPVVQAPPQPLEQAPTATPDAQALGRMQYAKNPTAVADFVNSATGNLLWDTDDLTVAGVGKRLDLVRTYNSLDTSTGLFGKGWSTPLDVGITYNAAKTQATVRGDDGQRVAFTWDPVTGRWVGAPGARATLKCSAKVCTVTRFDGFYWEVTGTQLTSYRDANGQGLTFGYTANKLSRITLTGTGSNTRTVNVTTNGAGRITKVQTPTRAVEYTYNGDLLTGFKDARGKTWTYAYTSDLLTSITDPDGAQRLAVTYSSGRVATLQQKGSPRHLQDSFAWDATNQRSTRTVTTSVNGALTDVDYVDTYAGNVLLRQDMPTGATMRYSHDAQLNLIAIQDPHGWVEELAYSPAGDLLSQTTPITSTSAAVVRFTYDNSHRMLTQTDPNGNTTTYVYNGPNLGSVLQPGPGSIATKIVSDTKGLVTQVTSAIGKQLFSYDQMGNRTVTLEQDLPGAALNGLGILATYDEAGHMTSLVDARGTTRRHPNDFKTTWQYDATGNLLRTTGPTGATTEQTYDDAGDVATSKDALGATTAFAWNESTLTKTSTSPSGTLTQVFDPSGNALSESSGGGGTTEHAYDGLGRETRTTSPAGTVTSFRYDGIGNVIGVEDSAGLEIRRQFDSRGLLVRQVENGQDTRSTYDRAGNTTSYRDAAGALTTRAYDAHNNVASVTDAAGTTSYAYDRADNVVSRTDGNGHVTTYTYDGMGRLLTTATGGRTWKSTYDETGNRVTTTDPDGRKQALTLDAANRTTQTVWTQTGKPTITVTEGYNAVGRRTSMTDAAGSHTFAYDAAGRLTSGDGFAYAYDAGEVSTTYPDGTVVVQTLDDTGAVMDVTSGTPGTAGYARAAYLRDAAHRTTGIAFSNGVLDTRRTDAAGNVLSDTLQRAGTTLASDAYSYDSGGNRLSQVHTAAGSKVTSTYSYDGANRITGFKAVSEAAALPPLATPDTPSASGGTVSGGLAPPQVEPELPTPSGLPVPPTAYGYDAVGNRTSAPGSTASFNALDQGTSGSGGVTRTFDLSGNETKLTTPTMTRTSTYDAAGRLSKVVTTGPSAGTTDYTYDGDGNRITRRVNGTLTKLVWDKRTAIPELVLERTEGNALVRRYIHGEGPVAMQTPTATFFLHLDPLGSTTELSDADGNVVAGYAYDGFGQVTVSGTGAPVVPLLFQGQYLDDASGLYYMRARDYDPSSGRFTSRDPRVAPVGIPLVSPYAFVNNRPTFWTDPTGESPLVDKIFYGQATENANIVNDTRYATTGTTVSVKGISKLGGFSAAAKAAQVEGAQAGTAAKVGQGLKAVGIGLAVVGIALQVYVTVETCQHGTVQACVGAAVGTAVSIAFTVGCTALTEGAGAVACGIVGGILSIGLQYVITEFGPQIVEGLIDIGKISIAALTVAWEETAAWFVGASETVAKAVTDAVDALVSGWNAGLAAVASGFQDALDVLVDAGYSAVELATVLYETFAQTAQQALSAIIDLGYDIADAAQVLADVFAATALEAAQLLKDAFDYTARQIAAVLDTVYDLAELAVTEVLKAVDFAVNEVADALVDVYEAAADFVADLLQDAGYLVNQIGAALKDVLEQADLAIAEILKDLEYTVQQVAGVLKDVLAAIDETAAQILKGAEFLVTEIANALKDVYDAVAQRAAEILKDLTFAATEVAEALVDAFETAVEVAAQILKSIEYAVTEVAQAIYDVFTDVAAEAAAVLRTIGYLAEDVITALEDAFGAVQAEIAGLLDAAGFVIDEIAAALSEYYEIAAAAVAQLLADALFAFTEIAGVLQSVFNELAADAAEILQAIGAGFAEIASLLQAVWAQAANAVAQILEDIGAGFAEIGQILKDVFNAAAETIAQILKDIGAGIQVIADFLEDVFNLAVDAIAGFLEDIGLGDLISTLGGAFEDFGEAVGDFFSSLF